MNITEVLNNNDGRRKFSIEVLPPLKGSGTEVLFRNIDKINQFGPQYINITTHHSEYVYRELENGQFERQRVRRRPGTIAIAAAIQQRYHVPVIPHLICSGATKEEIEYELIDRMFTATQGGYSHTTELINQVNRFNEGFFIDGSPMKYQGKAFEYGVAAYPEKHEEAPNIEMDMQYLKVKQDLGAAYAVTQLFYDNAKYFSFVERARKMGITIPIVPGIKPFAKLSQLSQVPKTFHCDMPQELAAEAVKCTTDEEAWALGIAWTTQQCKELYAAGVGGIHFYTISAVDSVVEVLKQVL